MSLATNRPGAGELGDVADIQISLLDGVCLAVGGVEIGLRGDRERALLARLALSPGAEVPRDVLVDDVWGSRRGKSGSGALRVQIKRLREHLTPFGVERESLGRFSTLVRLTC